MLNLNLIFIQMIANISNYKNIEDLVYIFLSILTVDTVVLFLVRYFPNIFGTDLNIWYNDFKLLAVLSDVMSIFLGFLMARYVYTIYLKQSYGWNPLLFVGLLVCIQVIHDVLFYLFVIRPLPTGHNAMIDRFKSYSTGGFKILGGDALLMISSVLLTFFFMTLPSHIVVAVSALVLYALTYILYTKPYRMTMVPRGVPMGGYASV